MTKTRETHTTSEIRRAILGMVVRKGFDRLPARLQQKINGINKIIRRCDMIALHNDVRDIPDTRRCLGCSELTPANDTTCHSCDYDVNEGAEDGPCIDLAGEDIDDEEI